nr:piggyBac transposable element-derived protein 2-like [Rhipicephalus microplus]
MHVDVDHSNEEHKVVLERSDQEAAARASRYNRQKKERSEIPCPVVITIYNKHKGGVDLLDSLISVHRPYLKLKRYYFRVFLNILDLTAVNAWLLYKRNALSKKDEYAERADFKMDLAASLCKAGKTVVKKRGRPSNESIEQASQEKRKRGPTDPAPTKDVRLDQVGHWLLWNQKRQRCKFPSYTGICMSYCVKCEVHLCSTNKSNCFFCTIRHLAGGDGYKSHFFGASDTEG